MTELPKGNSTSELFAEEEFRKRVVKLCYLLVGLDKHVDLLMVKNLVDILDAAHRLTSYTVIALKLA